MPDKITREHRSWNMSRVRSKDTKIERLVRSTLHRMGFRFRKNVRTLPGTPDIVLPKFGSIIFVNGCFWHQHKHCIRSHIPKSNRKYWKDKLRKNVERDATTRVILESLGWRVFYIWQCEINEVDELRELLRKFLIHDSN